MRIGFDVRPFLKEETGIGIYFKNLLFSLSQIDQDNEYYLFSSSFKDRFLAHKIPPFSRMRFRDFPIPVKAVSFFWNKLGWPPLDYFFKTGLDLTHSPSPLILPTKGKKVITVYDLFFMDFPNMTDKEARKDFLRKTEGSLNKADGIVTISQFTKKQLTDRFSLDQNKVKVIYLGLNQSFWKVMSQEELEETRTKYALPSTFLLFVGALEPRKNLLNLIEALKIIHEKHKKILLVLVGPKRQDYKNVINKIKELELEPWIRMVGYVYEKELRTFYRLASVFVFPSLLEGFGLPLLEAMASDLPVAASQTSAITEIVKDACLYFNPYDPEDMAEKIILVLEDKNLQQALITRGKRRASDFNWEKTAAETLSFYRSLLER